MIRNELGCVAPGVLVLVERVEIEDGVLHMQLVELVDHRFIPWRSDISCCEEDVEHNLEHLGSWEFARPGTVLVPLIWTDERSRPHSLAERLGLTGDDPEW